MVQKLQLYAALSVLVQNFFLGNLGRPNGAHSSIDLDGPSKDPYEIANYIHRFGERGAEGERGRKLPAMGKTCHCGKEA